MTEPVRLSKFLAHQQGISRREAEHLIAKGVVRVAGEIVEAPFFKVTDEEVTVDDGASMAPIEPLTLVWYQPPGTALPDPLTLRDGAPRSALDNSGADWLKVHFLSQQPLAELGEDESGLAVWSQNRGVIRKLGDDLDQLEQEYVVEVEGTLDDEGLKRIGFALCADIRGRKPKVSISWQSDTRLRIAMKRVPVGGIRGAVEEQGLKVIDVRRLRLGAILLGRMAPGEWRFLPVDVRF
ncbi:MAG: RNA pseudouridine synthase [Cobetia sp.]|uniref:RNA pseudouridine synthase n=1 Tax=Cobetia sp. TaxID=1873876 RepID=UPI0032428707